MRTRTQPPIPAPAGQQAPPATPTRVGPWRAVLFSALQAGGLLAVLGLLLTYVATLTLGEFLSDQPTAMTYLRGAGTFALAGFVLAGVMEVLRQAVIGGFRPPPPTPPTPLPTEPKA